MHHSTAAKLEKYINIIHTKKAHTSLDSRENTQKNKSLQSPCRVLCHEQNVSTTLNGPKSNPECIKGMRVIMPICCDENNSLEALLSWSR